MVSNIADPYSLTLFTAQSGVLSARLDHSNGTSLHLHSLVAPEREADYYSNQECWGDRLILLGCGLGYHLRHVLATLPENATILIVEYYKELANRTRNVLPEELHSRITVITNNDDNWQAIATSFLIGGRFTQTIKHPASFKAHPEFYEKVTEVLFRKAPQVADVTSVAVMQGDFFVENEMCNAAEKNGCKIIPFQYKNYLTLYEYENHLQRLIQYSAPSVFISINMLGCDASGILGEYSLKAGIPVVIWFVDDPHPILLNQKKCITPNMIACTWERAYIPWLKKQGFTTVHYLPLATDPVFFGACATVDPQVNFGFVGSAMGREFLDGIAEKFLWKLHYQYLAEHVADLLLKEPNAEPLNLLFEVDAGLKQDISEQNLVWLRSYCIHTASMLKRKRTISRLLPFDVQTFGDPDGWRQLFGDALKTNPDFDYRTGICDHYRKSSININITSCQMPTAVNQRVFDAPMSGSFILNDAQNDLEVLFSSGEYVSYASLDELAEKGAYYLRNESERNTVVLAAREQIMRKHTYAHRFIELTSLING